MFWKYINNRRNRISDIGDLKLYGIHGSEVLISSDEDKANALRQLFLLCSPMKHKQHTIHRT